MVILDVIKVIKNTSLHSPTPKKLFNIQEEYPKYSYIYTK